MTELTPTFTIEEIVSPERFRGRQGAGPKFEKPWHRHAAQYLAGGFSCRETAEFCGVTAAMVTNLMRAPWFGERVNEILAKSGALDVMQVLTGEALASVATMVELRDGEKTPAAVKANIAKDILDRVLGKPKQFIETTATTVSDDPVAEAKRLEEEANRLRKDVHGLQ